jgi:hypothetical protein
METPHLTELVRRTRLEDPNVDIHVGKNGAVSIVWCDPRVDDPLTLLVTEDDLAAAETVLGEDCRGRALARKHHRWLQPAAGALDEALGATLTPRTPSFTRVPGPERGCTSRPDLITLICRTQAPLTPRTARETASVAMTAAMTPSRTRQAAGRANTGRSSRAP